MNIWMYVTLPTHHTAHHRMEQEHSYSGVQSHLLGH